ncbi:MAG: DciA family protein [Atribacterota bacterium]
MSEKPASFFSGRPTRLREILNEFLKKEGLLEKIQFFQQVNRFGEYFPELSLFCHVQNYHDGVLLIQISDPIFSLEVQKRIPDIITTYQEKGVPIQKVKIRCQ